MPLQAIQIDRNVIGEFDAHHVDQAILGRGTARRDGDDIVVPCNDAFGEQKADGELVVVAGRTHRDRNALLGSS